jgi:hypothetical protein
MQLGGIVDHVTLQCPEHDYFFHRASEDEHAPLYVERSLYLYHEYMHWLRASPYIVDSPDEACLLFPVCGDRGDEQRERQSYTDIRRQRKKRNIDGYREFDRCRTIDNVMHTA